MGLQTSQNFSLMIKHFLYSARFKKNLEKLPRTIKKEAIEEINFFKENPHHIHFRTHQLQGKMSTFYSFSVLPDLRIVFRFTRKDHSEVLFYDIGSHEIYK